MKVLLQDSGRILHRHVIARERHHLAAEGDVKVVKGGTLGRFPGGFSVVAGPLHRALGGSPGTIPRKQPVEAPSVAVPESIIPSADAIRALGPSAPLSRCRQSHAVLLPESFRGGCS